MFFPYFFIFHFSSLFEIFPFNFSSFFSCFSFLLPLLLLHRCSPGAPLPLPETSLFPTKINFKARFWVERRRKKEERKKKNAPTETGPFHNRTHRNFSLFARGNRSLRFWEFPLNDNHETRHHVPRERESKAIIQGSYASCFKLVSENRRLSPNEERARHHRKKGLTLVYRFLYCEKKSRDTDLLERETRLPATGEGASRSNVMLVFFHKTKTNEKRRRVWQNSGDEGSGDEGSGDEGSGDEGSGNLLTIFRRRSSDAPAMLQRSSSEAPPKHIQTL